MKNFKLILRLLLRDKFKRREKSQVLIMVLLGVFYLFLMIMSVTMMVAVSPAFKSAGRQAELITLILFVDFALTIVFGIIAAISLLFVSKDVEFFKSLPVKPSEVFMAKLGLVYLTEAVLSASILIPCMLTAGFTLNLSAIYFCLIPIFVLTLPIFALMFIAIFSLFFMRIISLFKNRGAVSSIAAVAVFALFFGAYMFFASNGFSVGAHEEAAFDGIIKFSRIVSFILYPVFMLAKFAAKQPVFGLSLPASMAVEAAIFMVALIGLMLASYLLSLAIYNRVAGRLLENHNRRGAKTKSFVSSGGLKALMKMEWRGVIRNPSVAMQVASGAILCPMMVIFFSMMFVNMGEAIATDPSGGGLALTFDASNIVWVMCTMALMCFGIGINHGAATCISREGRGIGFLKALPIAPQMMIKAKHRTYMAISSVSIVTGYAAMIVAMVIYGAFVWWMAIGILPVLLSWLYAITALSIFLDLRNPKLDWKSFREVIKRGKNNILTIIWMLFSMLSCSLLMVLVLVGAIVDITAVLIVFYAVMTGLGVAAALICGKLLNDKTDELYKNLNN